MTPPDVLFCLPSSTVIGLWEANDQTIDRQSLMAYDSELKDHSEFI